MVVRRAVRAERRTGPCSTAAASGFTDKTIHAGTQYVYSVQSFDQAENASSVISVTGRLKVLT